MVYASDIFCASIFDNLFGLFGVWLSIMQQLLQLEYTKRLEDGRRDKNKIRIDDQEYQNQ